ncbi:hypothetical protein B0H11DRAFT_2245368 [Mycena galericulata]|nr:hypothetical protein B0H11DRAFT_2245368 [Mycena galericulata]
MADVVGLIASVLQLVDVIVQSRDYVKGFRDAPKDQLALLHEIQGLENLFRELDRRIKSNRISGHAMDDLRESLVQVRDTMKRLIKKVDSDGISKISRRLVWPLWGKKDVQEGLDTIERFKSLLTILLGMDLSESAQDLSSAVQDVADTQLTIHRDIITSVENSARNQREYHGHTIAALHESTEDQRISNNYISKSVRNVQLHHDAVKRDADILATRQLGTGEWLLEESTFSRWKSGTGKILWCRGTPGVGKTVLASIVVDHLTDIENVGVAAIYLNHKETDMQSPSNLLASLWRQFIFQKSLSPAVKELYEKHHERRTTPSVTEIRTILRSTISEYSRVYVVVDALDEYPQDQRDTLLRHLLELQPLVNLLFMSRPHIKIDHVIPDLEILEIRATDHDIRRHIDAQIVKSSRLSKHIQNYPGLREEIEQTIIQRSDGMFLLAKLHIDSLVTKHTVKAARDALNSMPRGLDNTYDEVVERINRQSEDDKDLAWLILAWITNAKRPLRPSELREALAVEAGATELDPDNLLDTETILSVCAGLVVLNEEDDIIRFIHYTAQSYFDRVQDRVFPLAQVAITTTCITYLSFGIFTDTHDPWSLFHKHPFLDYAVEYSLIHARGEPESCIRPSILSFLENCLVLQEFWSWKHPDKILASAVTQLSIAAFFGLEDICRHIMDEPSFASHWQRDRSDGLTDSEIKREVYGKALQAAASQGHASIARLLIERGADVNLQAGTPSALRIAALNDDETMMSLLLNHGANTNEKGGPRLRALLLEASEKGNEATVKLLIEHGADVNAQNQWYGSALQSASSMGHGAIVKLLIENGADVNAQHDWYGSALRGAALMGHESIVKLLIECGADVNGECGRQGSALQAAIEQGHEGIVELLIAHGADTSREGGWAPRKFDPAHRNQRRQKYEAPVVPESNSSRINVMNVLTRRPQAQF